jgi:hypothetical protein
MHLTLLLSLVGLAIANDALFKDPSITTVYTTDANGLVHTLIPMVMTNLTGLDSTTTVTTTITEANPRELLTPTHTISGQPSGIWWRDGLLGPPIPIPEFALTVSTALPKIVWGSANKLMI